MSKNLKIKIKKEIKVGKIRRTFKFKSKVIVWAYGTDRENVDSAWRFARVSEKISAEIKEMQKGKLRRGWGAIYVKAKVKKSEWVTSIFPDRYSPTYILPLKKQIRFEENLYDNLNIKVTIGVWF
ncbi:MAG: DUF1905 domain-containing protein [Candidatus Paceibacterota bacterium]